MPPERVALSVDAGGTFLKGGLVDAEGRELAGSLAKVPVDSAGPREGILGSYAEVVSRGLDLARVREVPVAGVGVATPGPFDYAGGRSLMQHKFREIHGVDLRAEIRRRCALPDDLPIRFLHDVHAFVSGEILRGAARGRSRVAGVTIGTGVGFGCIVDRVFLDNGAGSPRVSLYKRSYGTGIVEDVVSRRGIIAGYRARSGSAEDIDVLDIASLARDRGDPHALETFRHTARVLVESVAELLRDAGIECLVLGGQIARAYDLMEPELARLLERVPTLRVVRRAENIDLAALYGAARMVFES